MLEELLQVGHQQKVFTSQPLFHKLCIHVYTSDMNIMQYTMLHDPINNVFNACDTQDHEDENELYIASITFKVEYAI